MNRTNLLTAGKGHSARPYSATLRDCPHDGRNRCASEGADAPSSTKSVSSRTRGLWVSLFAVAILLPLSASAQLAAITTQAVNMRAGPDRSFPLVTWLPPGTGVNVVGCIDGWRWCDVVWGFNRGWIFARFLSMVFQNQPTVIFNTGAMLGVPIISFSIGNYWGLHYRNRPWWNNRNYWYSRPPSWNRPPPRPPAVRPPPRPPPRPPVAQPRPPRPPPPSGGRPPSSGGSQGGGRPPSGGRPPQSGRPPSDNRPPSGGRPSRDSNS